MRHLFQIIGSFLTFTFHKVSTRLKCGGIFNDFFFITRLLMCLKVKEF